MVPRKYLVLVAMASMLISFDQLTKFLVTSRIKLGESVAVIDHFFHLTLVYNSGAAFGLFANLPPDIREPIFFLVPGITLVFVLTIFARLKESQQLSIYALAMVVGGALGNLMDRIRLGKVVDFLDFHWRQAYHFPAFNLADSAITLGVFLLFLSVLFKRSAPEGSS
jgi:signal peptidase II